MALGRLYGKGGARKRKGIISRQYEEREREREIRDFW
jgi:hypothetical protein